MSVIRIVFLKMMSWWIFLRKVDLMNFAVGSRSCKFFTISLRTSSEALCVNVIQGTDG